MAERNRQIVDVGVDMSDEIAAPPAQPATAAVVGRAVVSVGITTATGLWMNWARIAVRGENAAWEARAALQRQKNAGLPLDVANDELEGALTAINGASFAIDGFYGSIAGWIVLPQQLAATWKAQRTPREARIVETLKAGYSLGSVAVKWQTELPWLFDLRNENVHYDAEFRLPVAHPILGNVPPERVLYSAEAARRAADVLFDVITTCDVQHLRPTAPQEHVNWCIGWEQNIKMLSILRENLRDARALVGREDIDR